MRLVACGVCHTDMYTASGADPSGYAPAVLGHEGAGVVEAVGEGVSSLAVGDHVVTLFSPQCRECVHCVSPRTNLCMAIRAEQNLGHLPDGTTRLSRDGEPIRHFMGTSTFAEYTVMPEIALAKVSPEAPLERARCSPAGSRPGSARRCTPPRSRRARPASSSARAWSASARSPAPPAGRRADHLRRPVRGPARAGPRPGRDRHLDRRRRHRPADPRRDRRLRRRLHLRGDRPRVA